MNDWTVSPNPCKWEQGHHHWQLLEFFSFCVINHRAHNGLKGRPVFLSITQMEAPVLCLKAAMHFRLSSFTKKLPCLWSLHWPELMPEVVVLWPTARLSGANIWFKLGKEVMDQMVVTFLQPEDSHLFWFLMVDGKGQICWVALLWWCCWLLWGLLTCPPALWLCLPPPVSTVSLPSTLH